MHGTQCRRQSREVSFGRRVTDVEVVGNGRGPSQASRKAPDDHELDLMVDETFERAEGVESSQRTRARSKKRERLFASWAASSRRSLGVSFSSSRMAVRSIPSP